MFEPAVAAAIVVVQVDAELPAAASIAAAVDADFLAAVLSAFVPKFLELVGPLSLVSFVA